MSIKKPRPGPVDHIKTFERQVGRTGYAALKRELAQQRQREAEEKARKEKEERRRRHDRQMREQEES